MEVEILQERGDVVRISGVARVDGEVVCQAVIMAGIKK
jgi:3-hydroxymyristoyl/3-hydroxydecanoyl-(acyl carrier protein) dehydratase